MRIWQHVDPFSLAYWLPSISPIDSVLYCSVTMPELFFQKYHSIRTDVICYRNIWALIDQSLDISIPNPIPIRWTHPLWWNQICASQWDRTLYPIAISHRYSLADVFWITEWIMDHLTPSVDSIWIPPVTYQNGQIRQNPISTQWVVLWYGDWFTAVA